MTGSLEQQRIPSRFIKVAGTAVPHPAKPALSRFMAAHPRLSRLIAENPKTAAAVLTFAQLILRPFLPAPEPGIAADFDASAQPRRRKKSKFRH